MVDIFDDTIMVTPEGGPLLFIALRLELECSSNFPQSLIIDSSTENAPAQQWQSVINPRVPLHKNSFQSHKKLRPFYGTFLHSLFPLNILGLIREYSFFKYKSKEFLDAPENLPFLVTLINWTLPIFEYFIFQVQILSETVAYIDQLHHKLLHQIHSVGLPPQLIKGA